MGIHLRSVSRSYKVALMNTPDLPQLKDRLIWARERTGLEQKEVCDRVGMATSTYNRLEKGKNQKTSFIAQIADVYGVNPIWLATGRGSHVVTRITKLDENSTTVSDSIDREVSKTWIEVMEQKGTIDEIFKFANEGDSMQGGKSSDIPPGSIVRVDPKKRGTIGAIHLAEVGGHPAIGVLQALGGRLFLAPNNQRYPAFQIEESALVGQVIGYYVNL